MLLIFTHPNLMIVENARNLLLQAGIRCRLENQYAAGGIGELAPISAWPELWLERERDKTWATSVLGAILTEPATQAADATTADWRCRHCGEINAPAFEVCWQCQAPP